MIPTPEQAWNLLCEFNEGDFHRKHGRIVGDVLRQFAQELLRRRNMDIIRLTARRLGA